MDRDRVLLGLKKRGFGQGKWNGFGGKVEAGETVAQAATRELYEEAGIMARAVEKRGVMDFTFEVAVAPFAIHVFAVNSFAGEPRETGEMQPQWFALSEIPYEAMWADDRHWLPLLLAGKSFAGSFHFRDAEALLKVQVREVAQVS